MSKFDNTIEELERITQECFADTRTKSLKTWAEAMVSYLRHLEDDVFTHKHDTESGEMYIEKE